MKPSAAIIVVLSLLAGVLAGLCCYTFIYAKGYSYLTNNPAACTNCHVMQAEYDAWVKSSHRAAATSNDCHTPHNLIGKYAVKANNRILALLLLHHRKVSRQHRDHELPPQGDGERLPPLPREHYRRHRRPASRRRSREAGGTGRESWIVIRGSWMAGYDLRFTLRGSPSASILRCS